MFSWARFLRPASVLVLILACTAAAPANADAQIHSRRLDKALSNRARIGVGESRVIVTFKAGWDASEDAKRLGARLGRQLNRNRSRVMQLSNAQLETLANHPAVERIRWDRPVYGLPNDEPSVRSPRKGRPENLGYTGDGIGVAVIDSGITPWHDELTYSGSSPKVLMKGGQRVAAFVDFVNGRTEAYDDYGHGTHVAGIIVGNGLGSNGTRKGSAPDAHLVVLKVLDEHGQGTISNVIAALEYVIANRDAFNIRVVNMSIAAAVVQSTDKDLEPDEGCVDLGEQCDDDLAFWTKEVVDDGIVVIAAAGNLGLHQVTNKPQYGGITAPGNAPWVLTVGAYDQNGTASSHDDVIAPYSSRGPTAFDFHAKPDVVAPGTAIVSLADPTSELYARKTDDGSLSGGTGGQYISLSGTSVAAPAVSGTVALMMQAYPALTPNLAKAIVQYTASVDPDYDVLTQGAGFLNPGGAVQLSGYFAQARVGSRYPRARTWSRKIIWGNYMVSGGVIWPNASAWDTGTVWGAMPDEDDDNIVWGTLCAPEDCDNIVWGTAAEDLDNIVWGTGEDVDNIVWGTAWRETADGFNIVWGTLTEDGDNIVWGTCVGEDCDNIVWGTLAEDIDNIVWGTLAEDLDNIVWGTQEDLDNIVWGTECDGLDCEFNIVWGTTCDETACGFDIVWGTSLDIVLGTAVGTAPAAPSPAPPWSAPVKKTKPRGSSRR